MKPMLASAVDKRRLRYPLLLSPKLDGVRCVIINGVAMSRSLKPIPNRHVQKLFGSKRLNGLDGELVVGPPNAPDAYRQTTSGVMSAGCLPDVHFYVFDSYLLPGGFQQRLGLLKSSVMLKNIPATLLEHYPVEDESDLLNYEEDYVSDGFEGVMLRDPNGPYKHGRSTEKEGWLLKLKRFFDAEAEVLGWVEQYHNANQAKRNALGHVERSSHKANLVPTGKLGALLVRDLKTSIAFDIGTGFTDDERVALWKKRDTLKGRLLKYKSQPTGVKDKPRFPVFMGWRDGRDM